jgi:hypothetical protein
LIIRGEARNASNKKAILGWLIPFFLALGAIKIASETPMKKKKKSRHIHNTKMFCSFKISI